MGPRIKVTAPPGMKKLAPSSEDKGLAAKRRLRHLPLPNPIAMQKPRPGITQSGGSLQGQDVRKVPVITIKRGRAIESTKLVRPTKNGNGELLVAQKQIGH